MNTDQNDKIIIIESYTQSKTGKEAHNEDGIFVNDHYLAVVDGATSKTSKRYHQKTSGQIIRDVILEQLSKLNGGETCQEAIRTIHRSVVSKAEHTGIEHMCASVIIYSVARHEIWSVGDCQAIIGSQLISKKKRVDVLLGEVRSMAIHAMLQQGTSLETLREDDASRSLILPFLKLQKQFENKEGPYGYYVINSSYLAEHMYEKMAEIYPVPPDKQVILASDGYPVLKTSLAESEDELNRILKADPFGYKENLTTKGLMHGNVSFDDRSYLRFHISE